MKRLAQEPDAKFHTLAGRTWQGGPANLPGVSLSLEERWKRPLCRPFGDCRNVSQHHNGENVCEASSPSVHIHSHFLTPDEGRYMRPLLQLNGVHLMKHVRGA